MLRRRFQLECLTAVPFEELKDVGPVVKDAIIATDGKLAPNYEYIAKLREQKARESSRHKSRVMAEDSKKVLVLGAGFVCGPVVDFFAHDKHTTVTVASALPGDLERLKSNSSSHPDAEVVLDVKRDDSALVKLIREHDCVVSLLPYTLHADIAKICIENRRNMVTSSYLSPALQELHQQAVDAEITVMNEAGLDPGIDHMLAMECIDRIRAHGGKVESFVSWCGGLPAPEYSDNALRYKFSWSPKAMLLALMNPAKYLWDGETVEVPAGGAVLNSLRAVDFMPGFSFVGYPNRDSTAYAKAYGIENEVKTLLRGTLRYKGFAEAVKGFMKLGLLDDKPHPALDPTKGPELTWKQFSAHVLNQREDIFPDSLRNIAADWFGMDKSMEFKAVERLGLFSDEIMVERCTTPLDTLTNFLSKALNYNANERDLVVLHHDIQAQLPDGNRERHRIELVSYGDANGYSAMASTVGYTAAIMTKMILTGEVQKKGMVRPMSMDIYRPALARLEERGIVANRRVSIVSK